MGTEGAQQALACGDGPYGVAQDLRLTVLGHEPRRAGTERRVDVATHGLGAVRHTGQAPPAHLTRPVRTAALRHTGSDPARRQTAGPV